MYAESMMTIIDNMRDPAINHQMKYVEFLVFLCRLTLEHYESTEHKNEAFYKKLDHLLPTFLAYASLKCNFKFKELFKEEEREETECLTDKESIDIIDVNIPLEHGDQIENAQTSNVAILEDTELR